jgi:thiamine kinase
LISSITWQTFAKGSSNTLYWAQNKNCEYVLRINAGLEDAFGVDRHREQSVLKVIAGQSWAVKVLDNNIDAGFCLMRKHEPLTDSYDEARLAQQMICFLNELHELSLTVPCSLQKQLLFDYDELLDNYLHCFEEASVSADAFLLLSAMREGFKQLPNIEQTLVHQDLHRNNVCIKSMADKEQRIVIIDWEYGGWANPWLDISAIQQCFSVNEQRLQQLTVLNGLSVQLVSMGCEIAALINEALACIWYYYRAIRVSTNDNKTSINDNFDLSELATQIQSLLQQFTVLFTHHKEVLK